MVERREGEEDRDGTGWETRLKLWKGKQAGERGKKCSVEEKMELEGDEGERVEEGDDKGQKMALWRGKRKGKKKQRTRSRGTVVRLKNEERSKEEEKERNVRDWKCRLWKRKWEGKRRETK